LAGNLDSHGVPREDVYPAIAGATNHPYILKATDLQQAGHILLKLRSGHRVSYGQLRLSQQPILVRLPLMLAQLIPDEHDNCRDKRNKHQCHHATDVIG
jgi:hypothetical protein